MLGNWSKKTHQVGALFPSRGAVCCEVKKIILVKIAATEPVDKLINGVRVIDFKKINDSDPIDPPTP